MNVIPACCGVVIAVFDADSIVVVVVVVVVVVAAVE